MAKMSIEEWSKAVDGKGIEDVVEFVKSNPINMSLYRTSVREKQDDGVCQG